jgi:hypothetical protein
MSSETIQITLLCKELLLCLKSLTRDNPDIEGRRRETVSLTVKLFGLVQSLGTADMVLLMEDVLRYSLEASSLTKKIPVTEEAEQKLFQAKKEVVLLL